jgi:uncharacterized protein DUF2785
MTDWATISAAGFEPPASRALGGLVDELTEALTSPDPVLRDEQAYPILASWVLDGRLDSELTRLGDRMVAMFGHPEIQARSFAALILATVVHRDTAAGVLAAPDVLRWRDGFAAWWLSETDLRGWDSERGWLHAVAHGADVVGELGLSPRLGAGDLAGLLDLACARLLARTGELFAHEEDDRVALAMATVLTRAELSAQAATGWLVAVGQDFEKVEPGPLPFPPYVPNTLRTLRSLYLMVDRGFRADLDAEGTLLPPYRDAILPALGEVLHLAFPHQA